MPRRDVLQRGVPGPPLARPTQARVRETARHERKKAAAAMVAAMAAAAREKSGGSRKMSLWQTFGGE